MGPAWTKRHDQLLGSRLGEATVCIISSTATAVVVVCPHGGRLKTKRLPRANFSRAFPTQPLKIRRCNCCFLWRERACVCMRIEVRGKWGVLIISHIFNFNYKYHNLPRSLRFFQVISDNLFKLQYCSSSTTSP